jgi:hypothetical protein
MSFVTDELSPSFSSSRVTRTCCLLIRPREEQERAGVPSVGDPLLRACDPPAAVEWFGLRPQGSRVRAGLRLSQRERAEMLAARQRGHEPRLLLVGAVREDGQCRGTRVDGDGHTDSGIGA